MAALPGRADRFEHNQEVPDELLGVAIDVISALSLRGLLKDWAVATQPVLSVPPGVQVQVDETPGPEWALQVRQRDKQFGAKIDRSLGTVLKTISSQDRELPYRDLYRALPTAILPSCPRSSASSRRRASSAPRP